MRIRDRTVLTPGPSCRTSSSSSAWEALLRGDGRRTGDVEGIVTKEFFHWWVCIFQLVQGNGDSKHSMMSIFEASLVNCGWFIWCGCVHVALLPRLFSTALLQSGAPLSFGIERPASVGTSVSKFLELGSEIWWTVTKASFLLVAVVKSSNYKHRYKKASNRIRWVSSLTGVLTRSDREEEAIDGSALIQPLPYGAIAEPVSSFRISYERQHVAGSSSPL